MHDLPESRWLDTETKTELEEVPPKKLAPPTTDTFAVVVLGHGTNPVCPNRIRGFHRILRTTLDQARQQSQRPGPFVLIRDLTLSDAMLAQFELICCDVVSVFIADRVLSLAEESYLSKLYESLKTVDEFAETVVHLSHIPNSEQGRKFLDQFVGDQQPSFPIELVAMRKKARIMQHWANRIGGQMQIVPTKARSN